jgi:TetR/AcrR family transcriptional regulator, transcriptional repressor for nem operon
MRYPKEHKARTRRRIVETAARAFRAKGLDGVGVADLMAEAGLTHGGFYAHFDSKDALIEAACRHGIDATIETLDFRARGAPPGEGLRTIVRAYLSRSHRDDAARGCVMPCLAGEIARRPPATRRAFSEQLERLVAVIARQLPTGDDAERERRALGVAASLVGALALARAVDDRTLSDAILDAARAFVLDGATPRA